MSWYVKEVLITEEGFGPDCRWTARRMCLHVNFTTRSICFAQHCKTWFIPCGFDLVDKHLSLVFLNIKVKLKLYLFDLVCCSINITSVHHICPSHLSITSGHHILTSHVLCSLSSFTFIHQFTKQKESGFVFYFCLTNGSKYPQTVLKRHNYQLLWCTY